MSRKLRNKTKAIQRVVEWFESSGWTVTFDNDYEEGSECDPQSKTLTVNEKTEEKRLWVLLHEGGHAQIFASDDYDEAFGQIIKQHNKPSDEQSKRYHYQKLKEEMLAWETGLNIAKMLNIWIDEVRYERYAAASFMTYVYEASLKHYQDAAQEAFAAHGLEINFKNVA